jgi:hypothetical protein
VFLDDEPIATVLEFNSASDACLQLKKQPMPTSKGKNWA